MKHWQVKYLNNVLEGDHEKLSLRGSPPNFATAPTGDIEMNEEVRLPASYLSLSYTCHLCNQKTRISLKKKEIYSHVKLGTTTICEGSSQKIDFEQPAADPVRKIVPVSGPAVTKKNSEAVNPKKIPKPASYHEYPTDFGESVRAIQIGHPGSGKRK